MSFPKKQNYAVVLIYGSVFIRRKIMNKKRIIALILAVSFLFSGFALSGEVSEIRRTVEGYIETVSRTIRSAFEQEKYENYTELCDIPETENGYVPQGYCINNEMNLHFISYYHSKNASVIAVVDGENGRRIKTVSLEANGKAFKGHAGGIAEDGAYFYVVDGKKIYRMSLAELLLIPDGGTLVMKDYITADVKCSYLNSDGKYLYAGEFYTFTTDGSYDTDKSHHIAISLFETSYSRCNAYLISDIADKFSAEAGEIAVPEMIFTTPNCVQGFARLSDGTFALATSYGRNNNSFMKYYADVTKGESDFEVAYGEKSVPAYHLCNSNKTASHRQPPMLEGIDDRNGKAAGIFESGAEKYSDSKFIVNKICEF